jgi:ubiquinone/menaquinone biosynthesis C-methylase UbiE
MEYDKVIKHYREQAVKYGAGANSAMPDLVVRAKEVEALHAFVLWVYQHRTGPGPETLRVLDVCCGNGYLLGHLFDAMPSNEFDVEFSGIELVPEMVEIANGRGTNALIVEGNVLDMPYSDGYFDVVLSERGIINILDEDKQVKAYGEIARVLRSHGHCALIEGFKDGLENLNKARQEFLLPPILEPPFNNWYTKERWSRFLGRGFVEIYPTNLVCSNFLSSHYFVTRFLHDVVRPEGGALRNTEFAAFFSQALPLVGNYSPVQIKYLVRR